MRQDPPSRTPVFAGTLLCGGLTGLAALEGWSLPLLSFVLMATLVSGVGTSEVIAEIAPWYDVLGSAILGLYGVGLLLLDYDTPLVVGLTGAFVVASLLFAVRYRRARRAALADGDAL